MKFLDQLGDAVKDVKELAKSKASVVKDLTADAAKDITETVKEKSVGAAKEIRDKVAETTSKDKTSGK